MGRGFPEYGNCVRKTALKKNSPAVGVTAAGEGNSVFLQLIQRWELNHHVGGLFGNFVEDLQQLTVHVLD